MKKNNLGKIIEVLLIIGYFVLAYDTYGKITDLEVQLREMEQSISTEYETKDEIPKEEAMDFNSGVHEYYKWRNTLQCFWMEYIYDFKDFQYIR